MFHLEGARIVRPVYFIISHFRVFLISLHIHQPTELRLAAQLLRTLLIRHHPRSSHLALLNLRDKARNILISHRRQQQHLKVSSYAQTVWKQLVSSMLQKALLQDQTHFNPDIVQQLVTVRTLNVLLILCLVRMLLEEDRLVAVRTRLEVAHGSEVCRERKDN